ncbi:dipeptidyl-peptidase 5 [Arthrobacter halodurans]|uniref:Prolyl oligopeptidase family serine peptidase n=1 Tax=Arthrobacter halodurans TaxID=516699 RepID=A0ABV4ULL5_9MICC
MTLRAAYGSWPSPITARQLAVGTVPLGSPGFAGDELWWLEGRPAEGGRMTILAQARYGGAARDAARAEPRELVKAPFNVRSRVNEYGGTPWASVELGGRHRLVFVNFADQRAYLLDPAGGGPRPLTPVSTGTDGGDPALRFAEFTRSAGADGTDAVELLAQCEDHRGTRIERYVVAIPLDGSAAADAGALRRVTPSSRFVAGARVSPDGRRIAWICWEHPQMPWDGTVLRVADLRDGVATGVRDVAGSASESVLQPEWLDDGTLVFVSDRSGWWNLYAQSVEGGAGPARPLCPLEEEFAGPLWQVGTAWYRVLDAGRLLVAHGTHGMRLGVLDVESGRLTDLDLPFTHALPAAVRALGPAGDLPAADLPAQDPYAGDLPAQDPYAGDLPTQDLPAGDPPVEGPPGGARDGAAPRFEVLATSTTLDAGDGIRLIDLETGAVRDVRLALADRPDPDLLPEVRSMEFPTPDGPVYANVYAPRMAGYAGLEGELPPFVAFVHGGPTSQARAGLSLGIAYYTSRGIGVVDVNYGGSTGYGRAYRERLKGQWGVVDVADTVAVMDGLVAAGIADGRRLAIEGGSAGGWTALACLTSTDTFDAGVSRYGVADLEALVTDTHDFESRYLEGLVGPWPEARELYRDRAPVNHVDGLSCPVLLLQGDEDRVVPPSQSQAFADALAAKGIPHAYVLFAGEQHGFRRAENIVKAYELTLAFYARVFGFDADVAEIELVAGTASRVP